MPKRIDYPAALKRLIGELKRLPGIGPRSAERIALWMIQRRDARTAEIARAIRSEEHTSELQSRLHLVCRLLLEKKKKSNIERLDNFLVATRASVLSCHLNEDAVDAAHAVYYLVRLLSLHLETAIHYSPLRRSIL